MIKIMKVTGYKANWKKIKNKDINFFKIVFIPPLLI